MDTGATEQMNFKGITLPKKKPRNEKDHFWICRRCKRELRQATMEEIDAKETSWSHKYFLTICDRCASVLDQKAYSMMFHGTDVECTCHPLPEDKRSIARKIWDKLP